jgi:DUF971 family protein
VLSHQVATSHRRLEQACERAAVRLQFDDLHGTGIFTWPFLYELGAHKFARMRRYVRALRARALSREPAARRSAAAAGGGAPGAATT